MATLPFPGLQGAPAEPAASPFRPEAAPVDGPVSGGPLSVGPVSLDGVDSVAFVPPTVDASIPPPFAETPRQPSGLAEHAGDLLGTLVSPLFYATSFFRRARTFHPRGDVCTARVDVDPIASGVARRVGERLRGSALLRFSSALDKGDHGPLARFDVLGCAVRFAYHRGTEAEGDQDLLFATIRRPWTMPFAPFATRVASFFANDYFAVSPFTVPGEPVLWFRIRPERDVAADARSSRRSVTRAERRGELARRITERSGRLHFEVAEGPFGPWERSARITLRTLCETAPALRFDPYRAARGIRPRGFVHALRRAVYGASQTARAAAHATAR